MDPNCTAVVVGAEYSLIHTEKRIDFKIKELIPFTGEIVDKPGHTWINCVNGIDYDDEQYSKFKKELNEEGLNLYNDEIIGIELVKSKYFNLFAEIDFEKIREAIVKVQPLLAKYGILPEQVKPYSVAFYES